MCLWNHKSGRVLNYVFKLLNVIIQMQEINVGKLISEAYTCIEENAIL